MRWVLDHLQFIIAAAGAVAWWLNQRRKGAAGGEEAPPPEATFDDPELAERTRKIREEIQRKIEQRARGYTQPEPSLTEFEEEAPPPIIREVVVARRSVRAVSRMEAQQQAQILEEQAVLMEKLRETDLMKTAAQKRLVFEAATADHSGDARAESRATVLDDLRTPAALRRAFILREVLGPPVALR